MGPVSPQTHHNSWRVGQRRSCFIGSGQAEDWDFPSDSPMRTLIIPRMKPRADEASNSVKISRPPKIVHFYVQA